MITLKSPREIDLMDKSGDLLASVHEHLRDFIKPGITGWDIENFVRDYIESHGGIPAQIGFEGYKYATCISINDEICHGFPTDYVLKDGDLVKVDMCVELDGAMSDSCWAYLVGEGDAKTKELMDVTKEALYLGIQEAQVGNRIGDIGHAIQSYVESKGYSVVREFVGHGIGPTIHEEPMIPHYGLPHHGLRLKEGMVITIEPMVNAGDWPATVDDNGWTARTIDGSLSCQYEHTLAITKEGPRILTKQKPGE
ncbi:type I methionyl aminopeptidase [Catellicoccus marimammalium]|uniref:Methionine aminopeptidase n=1 Tax=Catellicoccus marimammalium M35/04/3 TaxID=1234409 RepID=K8ZQ25_9ENTE|nr:type I methionyl aminopeptidase [Catellicoccus marimammalium]EKU27681.1 Methionine aminopeptidase [Catellicoccus marimammalium M35/04/3]